MPRNEPAAPFMLSLIDRLSEKHPVFAHDGPISQMQSLRLLKQSLARDLAWLLNTRRSPDEAWKESEELKDSILSFGLPDFTGTSRRSHESCERLRHAIEKTISTYEPRLMRVRVSAQSERANDRTLHFRISGQLNLQPHPEPIVFDTVLKIGTGDFHVREAL